MATFYVGVRPVLRGRQNSDFSNTFKATAKRVGTYSHYTLFGPGLLTGAPDNHHNIGTGYAPSGLMLSRRFRGLDTQNPLDAPGLGTRITGMRFGPHLNRAVAGAMAFPSGYGHAKRANAYSVYNNYTFDGVTSAQQLSDVGHGVRAIGSTGAPASFGSFGPNVWKGVGSGQALANGGQALPSDNTGDYGHNRINEWTGVPSSKALGV